MRLLKEEGKHNKPYWYCPQLCSGYVGMYYYIIYVIWADVDINVHTDGLMQDCDNSNALEVELLQFWNKPSIYAWMSLSEHCQIYPWCITLGLLILE